jgi:dCMP deaminase
MNKKPGWDEYFMALALVAATRSKDPNTPTGATIVKDRRVLGTGYNGLPRLTRESEGQRYVAPLKYKWFEHAERNAIYNCAFNGIPTEGATIYITWSPCSDCARAIIQAGIKRVVALEKEISLRWKDSLETAQEMLEEAEVEWVILPDSREVLLEALKI